MFTTSVSAIPLTKINAVILLLLPTIYQVDALRVESVVRGYAANAAEILPLQHPARTLLPPLLFCMACEVLHVRLLAPEVCDETG